MKRGMFRIVAAAALASVCPPTFSYKPLYENIDNLPLQDNRLVWHVWVPGESDDGDAWGPLFHDSVQYWNAELPYFDLGGGHARLGGLYAPFVRFRVRAQPDKYRHLARDELRRRFDGASRGLGADFSRRVRE